MNSTITGPLKATSATILFLTGLISASVTLADQEKSAPVETVANLTIEFNDF